MQALKLTTCMAENCDFICRALALYLSRRLSLDVEFCNGLPWPERERLFDCGEFQICWLCGLPYIRKTCQPAAQIELLAAPVMRGERYGNRPIYFSEVLVHHDSPFYSFADLRGARWAFNEPNSHSGHNLVAYYLSQSGSGWDYFGQVLESGAHQTSLRMLLRREADASAIDTIVLEQELLRQPEIKTALRTIEMFGPSPIPPFVVRRSLSADLRRALRTALLTMHEDRWGEQLLAETPVARFVSVADQDYDEIRRMERLAKLY